MLARAGVSVLVLLTAGALAALATGLVALFGVHVAHTVSHFEAGSGPHLRPAVLLPIVYVGVPALCTIAGAVALVRGLPRPARSRAGE
jgi:hypothetical protein